MLTMALIVGIWSTTCIQTQIANVNQGHVKETYSITQTGEYEFKREWFTDRTCTSPDGTDTESGTVKLGEKITTIFMPGEVYEADFSSQKGVDLGAVTVRGKSLRVARGVRNSTMRNTMLSLFEYVKQ